MFPGGWRWGCPRVWYEPPAPIPGSILKKWLHNAHILTVMLQKECGLKFMLKDKTFVQTNVSHQHSAPPSKLRCAVKKKKSCNWWFSGNSSSFFKIGFHTEEPVQMCLGLHALDQLWSALGILWMKWVDRLWWLEPKIPSYKIDCWSMRGHRKCDGRS